MLLRAVHHRVHQRVHLLVSVEMRVFGRHEQLPLRLLELTHVRAHSACHAACCVLQKAQVIARHRHVLLLLLLLEGDVERSLLLALYFSLHVLDV